jgi:hypothetical protein
MVDRLRERRDFDNWVVEEAADHIEYLLAALQRARESGA